MSRIEIHAASRAVIVDHDDLAAAEHTARQLWHLAATVPEAPEPGPATLLGFQAELAGNLPAYGDDCPATVHIRP